MIGRGQELRRQFLACREAWLAEQVADLDDSNAYDYLKRLTDVHRLQLFDVVMQYRAIFADGPSEVRTPMLMAAQGSPPILVSACRDLTPHATGPAGLRSVRAHVAGSDAASCHADLCTSLKRCSVRSEYIVPAAFPGVEGLA